METRTQRPNTDTDPDPDPDPDSYANTNIQTQTQTLNQTKTDKRKSERRVCMVTSDNGRCCKSASLSTDIASKDRDRGYLARSPGHRHQVIKYQPKSDWHLVVFDPTLLTKGSQPSLPFLSSLIPA